MTGLLKERATRKSPVFVYTTTTHEVCQQYNCGVWVDMKGKVYMKVGELDPRFFLLMMPNYEEWYNYDFDEDVEVQDTDEDDSFETSDFPCVILPFPDFRRHKKQDN